jgi:hypothetical protein
MPREYTALVEWHKLQGSSDSYTKMIVRQARETNAPQNAVFRRKDGRWATIDDLPADLKRSFTSLLEGDKSE